MIIENHYMKMALMSAWLSTPLLANAGEPDPDAHLNTPISLHFLPSQQQAHIATAENPADHSITLTLNVPKGQEDKNVAIIRCRGPHVYVAGTICEQTNRNTC